MPFLHTIRLHLLCFNHGPLSLQHSPLVDSLHPRTIRLTSPPLRVPSHREANRHTECVTVTSSLHLVLPNTHFSIILPCLPSTLLDVSASVHKTISSNSSISGWMSWSPKLGLCRSSACRRGRRETLTVGEREWMVISSVLRRTYTSALSWSFHTLALRPRWNACYQTQQLPRLSASITCNERPTLTPFRSISSFQAV